jgi:hypothetical protein
MDEPGRPYHGTFYRTAEEAHPPAEPEQWRDYDPNWREFVGTTFSVILHRFADRLPPSLVEAMGASIALAQRGEPDGRIPADYANIALMKAWLDADTGVRRGDRSLVEAGESFAGEVVARFGEHGAFAEYGSPTYYGIDLYALALWRLVPPTPRFATWAATVEATLWRDIARWYHPGLRNLCGPFSRAYGMDMRRYASLLGLWMVPALGPDAPFPALDEPFRHAHDLSHAPMAAILGPQVPDDALEDLQHFRGERTVEQVITSGPERRATGWLAEQVMIGGEDAAAGLRGDGQYHPATVHWRLPDGGVGTIRALHHGPLRARASAGRLEVRSADHGRRGPQPTSFSIDLSGTDQGPTAGVEVRRTDSGAEVTWPPGAVDLVLDVSPVT